MRILMIVERFHPEARSAAHLFGELATGLVASGHQVSVLTRMPSEYVAPRRRGDREAGIPRRELLQRVEVIRVRGLSTLSRFGTVRAVGQALLGIQLAGAAMRWGRADVVLIYSPPLALGLTGWLYQRRMESAFVLNLHDLYPQTVVDLGLLTNRIAISLAEALERFVYASARKIIVPAPGSQRVLITRKRVPAHKVHYVPNWIDTEHVTLGPKENAFRRARGFSGRFIVSYAGVMGFAQDLTAVLDAARRLEAKSSDLFVLAGDGVYQSRWRQLGRDLRNVCFLPMLPREEYFELLRASDICLVPLSQALLSPAIPGKVQSIMAVARPMIGIVNPASDAAEVIVKSESGLVVPPGDAASLAEAIGRLYSDPALCEAFGKNGRTYAAENYSLKKCLASYELILDEAVRAKRQAG